jgi:hypothetical protein
LANLPSESSSGKAGGTGEGNEFGLTNYIYSYFKGILYGADDFTFSPNEGVLRIFIALGRVRTVQWQAL